MFRASVNEWPSARALRALTVVTLAIAVLTGCVVQETRPLPKLEAVQAKEQIAESELLDVAVQHFDANIPEALKDNEESLDKRRI